MSGSWHPDEGDEVDRILGDYLERIDRGEDVSAEDLIAAHPEHAETLREFFVDEAEVYDLLSGDEKSGTADQQPVVRYFSTRLGS